MVLNEQFRKTGKNLGIIWTRFLEALFPRYCIYCGFDREGDGDFLCPGCMESIVFIKRPFCNCCGIPAEITYDFPIDDFEFYLCRKNAFLFDRAWSMGPYDSILKQMIHHFKYQGQLGTLSKTELLVKRYLEGLNESFEGFYVSPVPLHFGKMKERGFDQAFLIAQQFAGILNLPMAVGLLRR